MARLATAPSARAYEPQCEQEHDRSDCCVDNEADDSEAEMNTEAMQKPIADERADDANCPVPDKTESVAPNDLARQPSGNEPDGQNDNQTLARQMHAHSLVVRRHSRAHLTTPERTTRAQPRRGVDLPVRRLATRQSRQTKEMTIDGRAPGAFLLEPNGVGPGMWSILRLAGW
jgi:hypothetical protein